MAVALFVFIAWVIISVYFFVPKRLSTEEIILLFFLFTIITTNIFVILDFNLKLIQHNNKSPKLFISFWIHRNIIIPLTLIIFVNFMNNFKSKIKKFITTVLVFSILYLINLLAFGIGLLTYSTNLFYLGSAIFLAALMLLAFLTMKLVTKLPEGKSM